MLEPEKPAYVGAVEYDPAITVEVVPTDFNLRDHRIIITNLSPNQQFTSGSFVPAGIVQYVAKTWYTQNASLHHELTRSYKLV